MSGTEKRLEPGSLCLLVPGAPISRPHGPRDPNGGDRRPTLEMRDRITSVLKGHIALALARFPKGTTGNPVRRLVHRALWQEGLHYDHGTGHGLGSYLGVHEGPQRISKAPNAQALLPGMIV
jgi:Xaa-Pro aminopeptidase